MVNYEWIVEEVDEHGDIIETGGWDSAKEAFHYIATSVLEPGCHFELGICRDASYPNDTRSWAYVYNGKLPETFEDAACNVVANVPKRFHVELDRAVDDLPKDSDGV